VTGSEVFKGRIKDGFSPILHKKIEALGCRVNNEEIVPDDSGNNCQDDSNFSKRRAAK